MARIGLTMMRFSRAIVLMPIGLGSAVLVSSVFVSTVLVPLVLGLGVLVPVVLRLSQGGRRRNQGDRRYCTK